MSTPSFQINNLNNDLIIAEVSKLITQLISSGNKLNINIKAKGNNEQSNKLITDITKITEELKSSKLNIFKDPSTNFKSLFNSLRSQNKETEQKNIIKLDLGSEALAQKNRHVHLLNTFFKFKNLENKANNNVVSVK